MFTGIIETTGTLQRRADHGDDCTLTIASPTFDFSRCALGDSIAVSGVCLTAVALGADHFSADVSHETLRLTTLGALQPGDAVNLEVDLIARYLERLLSTPQQNSGLTLETLQKHGY